MIGQLWLLQPRVSVECGQALPPYRGAVVVRLRFCEPKPHDLEQLVQASKVSTVQSTGQKCTLQSRVSVECGQAAPPNRGATVVRARCCEPAPHNLVQASHADQPAT